MNAGPLPNGSYMNSDENSFPDRGSILSKFQSLAGIGKGLGAPQLPAVKGRVRDLEIIETTPDRSPDSLDPSWRISAKLPWSSELVTIYMTRQSEKQTPPPPGKYDVVLVRVPKRSGNSGDSEADYLWKLVEIAPVRERAPQAAQPQTVAETVPKPQIDREPQEQQIEESDDFEATHDATFDEEAILAQAADLAQTKIAPPDDVEEPENEPQPEDRPKPPEPTRFEELIRSESLRASAKPPAPKQTERTDRPPASSPAKPRQRPTRPQPRASITHAEASERARIALAASAEMVAGYLASARDRQTKDYTWKDMVEICETVADVFVNWIDDSVQRQRRQSVTQPAATEEADSKQMSKLTNALADSYIEDLMNKGM